MCFLHKGKPYYETFKAIQNTFSAQFLQWTSQNSLKLKCIHVV